MSKSNAVVGLKWVEGDIVAGLQRVRASIERFADSPKSHVELAGTCAELKEIRGVLLALDLAGPSRLVDEMQRLCDGLASNNVRDSQGAVEALMLALIQLPDYLAKLRAGQQDAPVALVPTINDLRGSRGAPPVTEAELLIPSTVLADSKAPLAEVQDSLCAVACTVRPQFHRCLLQWFKPESSREGLSSLGRLFHQLRNEARKGIFHELFLAAEAMSEALLDGSIPHNPETKALLGRLDRVIKPFAERSDAWPADEAETLLIDLLSIISRCGSSSYLANELRLAYGLEATSHIDEIESSLAVAPSPEAMSMLIGEARKELLPVKDFLDLYARGKRENPERLLELEPLLRALANTLAVTGADEIVERLRGCALSVAAMGKGSVSTDDDHLMSVAEDLLAVERALAQLGGGSTGPGAGDEETRQVLASALKEARAELAIAELAISALVVIPGDLSPLDDVPALLHRVAGVLRIVVEGEAANVLDLAAEQIRQRYLVTGRSPTPHELELLAQAISAIELYIDGLSGGELYRQDLVEDARSTIAQLAETTLSGHGVPTTPKASEMEPSEQAVAEPPPDRQVADGSGIDPEFLEIFLEEAEAEAQAVREHFARWSQDSRDEAALAALRRSFHTLKGSGRLVGAERVGEFGRAVEGLLNHVIDGSVTVSAELVSFVGEAVVYLPDLVAAEARGLPISADAMIARADALAAGMAAEPDTGLTASESTAAGDNVIPWPVQGPKQGPVEVGTDAPGEPESLDTGGSATDDAAYPAESAEAAEIANLADVDEELLDIFRAEVREHLKKLRTFLANEDRSEAAPGPVELRSLHTLTGSARMTGLDSVAAATAGLERLFRHHQERAAGPDGRALSLLQRALDAVDLRLAHLPGGGAEIAALREIADEAQEILDRSEGHATNQRHEAGATRSQPAPLALEDVESLTGIDAASAPGEESVVHEGVMERRPAGGEVTEAGLLGRAARESESGEHRPEDVDMAASGAESSSPEPDVDLAAMAEEVSGSAPSVVEGAEIDSGEEAPVQASRQPETGSQPPQPESERLQPEFEQGEPAPEPFETVEVLDAALEPESEVIEVFEALARGPEPPAPDAEREETVSSAPASDATTALPRAPQIAQERQPSPELTSIGSVAPDKIAIELEPLPEDAELLAVFLEDARDILDKLDQNLRELKAAPSDSGPLAGLQRLLHTLKGSARLSGLAPIGDLSHAFESLLTAITKGHAAADVENLELAQRTLDTLGEQVDAVERGKPVRRVRDLVQALALALEEGLAGRADAGPVPAVEAPLSPTPLPMPATGAALPSPASPAEPRRSVASDAAPQQIRVRADLLDRLVDHSGEVSIYRARLAQNSTQLGFRLDELDQTVARLREQLRLLEIETEAQIIHRYERDIEAPGGDEDVFDPLELDRFSTLQQLSRSLAETVNDLVSLRTILGDLHRESDTLLLQQSRIADELQDGLLRTRMVPFAQVVPRLHRLVRQTAQQLGKKARLEVSGADVQLDRTIQERIVAPLEHLLRNAVAHGIELPAKRSEAGKEAEGVIALTLRREGNDAVILVTDDGAGLNLEAIRRRAIERGLLSADAPAEDEELAELVLESGFSTASEVTQIAGRGVGLDVVNAEVKQLSGTFNLASRPGLGTSFTIRLPLTLAITDALLVAVGDEVYAIPHATIEGATRIAREDLEQCYRAGRGEFHYASEGFRVLYLGSLLLAAALPELGERRWLPVLLARVGDQRIAFHVDGLLGSQRIVVKPLGPQLSSIRWLSGGTILADGRVAIILDLLALIRSGAVHHYRPPLADAEAAQRRTCVMVVDDSLTVRRVTSRLLRRHDMEVVTARDGVEALSMLEERIPDLILLDIEMPRMDGYELTRHIRRSPSFREVPIIMITSRAGEKHRRYAMDLGVDRYLGKPYQEAELLDEIGSVLMERSL